MRLILIIVMCCLLIISCSKSHNNTCNCDCEKSTNAFDNSSMIGCWILTDTNYYTTPGPDPQWIPVSNASQSIIHLEADSSFKFDTNFPWKSENYDHFRQISNYIYLYSTQGSPIITGPFNPLANVQLTGDNELILTRNGIDYGVQERYKRY